MKKVSVSLCNIVAGNEKYAVMFNILLEMLGIDTKI